MLREPRQTERKLEPRQERKSSRFRLTKLEERIAPKCHTNPHGKEVGCGKVGKV